MHARLAERGRLCSSPNMPARSIPSAHYDRGSDVLYVSVGIAHEGDSVEQRRGGVPLPVRLQRTHRRDSHWLQGQWLDPRP